MSCQCWGSELGYSEAIEEIKSRLSIVDLISSQVPLKKAGRNYKGLCPFHSEKTPSFIVFPDKGDFHCFGCGVGGDVFTFVMKTQNLDFPEALRLLAERAGVALNPAGGESAADRERSRLFEINAAAAQFFHHVLLNSEEGAEARAYLNRRGIDAGAIESFQLGYALQSWDSLSRYLQEQGYGVPDLLAAGLVIERDSGGHYDRFRRRVIFPIRDERGRVSGFGGRALDDATPKYLNSPQTAVFDKGGTLYGIDLARQAIRQRDQAVIVEGYFDVIACHQHGANNVVASLGTALTDRQVSILKRLTKNLILALDPDAAGDEATLRGLEVAQRAYGGRPVPVPTWQGLIRFENRQEADLRIARLPRGKDPDEIVNESTAAWDALVASALPLVDYHFELVEASEDLGTAKGKSAAAARLLPLIGALRDGVQQMHYLQRLARLTRTSERTLEREMRRRVERAAEAAEDSALPSQRIALSLEAYCLALLLAHPSLIPNVVELSPADVDDSSLREVYHVLAEEAGRAGSFSMEAFAQRLGPILAERLEAVRRQASALPELSLPQAEKEVRSCILEMKRRRLRARLRDLEYIKRDAEAAGDLEAVRQFVSATEELRRELEPYEHASTRADVWR